MATIKQSLEQQAMVGHFLASPDGEALLDLMSSWYGGDTFDKDPYQHAHNAGARSVVLHLQALRDGAEKAK